MRLVASNDKPIKAKKIIYCPVCNGSTWFYVNQSRTDYDRPVKKKCCVLCLAQGKVTLY